MKNQITLAVMLLTVGVSSAFALEGGGSIGSSTLRTLECSVIDNRPGADPSFNRKKTFYVSNSKRSNLKLAPTLFVETLPAETIDEEVPFGEDQLIIRVYTLVNGQLNGPQMTIRGANESVSINELDSTEDNQKIYAGCKLK